MSDSRAEHRLGVVEEGILEPIAKLPASRVQTGSRATGTAASGRPNFRQTWSSIAPSLEILSPEEILEQVLKYNVIGVIITKHIIYTVQPTYTDLCNVDIPLNPTA